MKIGILTFHSQLNYGGVLQAYAMQLALQEMGHEAVIIDRWLGERNGPLYGPFLSNWKGWIGIVCRGLIGCRSYSLLVRHWRTICFIRKRLILTSYHFYAWEDAPKDLGVDVLLVGSDQVWNATFNNFRSYLLEGAPRFLPAIAYAASFGMRELPEALKEVYKVGFQRFKAISVREVEGVEFVESQGSKAIHVVDPTLLLSPTNWKQKVSVKSRKPKLVCYFLSEDVYAHWTQLEFFAKQYQCRVNVFVNAYQLPFPKTLTQVSQRVKRIVRDAFSPVKLELVAGPQDFLDAFASATWVLSDSFHAVMFSSIFEKNVRVLRPQCEYRQAMFARIEEIAKTSISSGSLIAEDVPSALTSLANDAPLRFNQEIIAQRRAESKAWLEKALALCQEKGK